MRAALALIAIALPGIAHAEGRARGYVLRDGALPVVGAIVRTASVSTTSGPEGEFELSLSAGEHALEILAGEQTIRTPAVPIADDRSTEIVVVLRGDDPIIEIEASVPVFESTVVETATATGRAIGEVVDAEGTPVAGARVLARGWRANARTDAGGRFELVLPAGARELTIIHPSFGTRVVRADVPAGSDTHVRAELVPRAAALAEMVIIIPQPDYGSVTQQLELRKQAAAVMDSVGLEDIKRSADSTASSATRRIVGASVVGGAYLNVRGLQGRYTNVRLNGVTLPSTDPDLPGFQIDLFPVSLLSSLNVVKAFTPDIPGDFTGGSLDILTRDFPEKLEISVNGSVSGATDTIGQKRLDYDGGSTDFLGFDDGTRALPDEVPDRRVAGGRNGLPREQIDEIGRAFTNEWTRKEARAIPDLSLGASIGDSIEMDENRLGYLLTLGYRFQTASSKERITNIKLEADRLAIREELAREVGKTSSQLGLLGNASYRIGEDHELKLVALFTQTGDDQTAVTSGLAENEGVRIEETELRFVARRLLFNQLLGRHLDVLDAFDLDWQLNFAWVGRDQPDTRNLLYAEGPQGFVYRNVPGSGERLFTELEQFDFGGGFDIAYPVLDQLKLEAGYLGRFSTRGFDARRFGHRYVGTAEERLLTPDQLFAGDSYGTIVELLELTRPDDGYRANQLLNAGYLMGDWLVLETLRIIGGARVEIFRQSIESSSPYADAGEPPTATARTDVDVLPALSAILPIGDTMNVRASYGGTIARPLVRELAPFLNQDFVRRRNIQGNPDLRRTYVHNFDLRWEWFPSESEVLAASLFYKIFQDPIEQVVLDQGGNITYDNIAGAQNFGGELEARVELDRIHDVMEGFNVVANFAIIHSRVSLSEEERALSTSESRPLTGQSPFVANLSLGWSPEWSTVSINVFYNVFGRRIRDAGRLGLPDVYEEPFHSVDATIFWKASDEFTVSLYGRNLLARKTQVTQDEFNFLEFDQGLSFGTRLAWTH